MFNINETGKRVLHRYLQAHEREVGATVTEDRVKQIACHIFHAHLAAKEEREDFIPSSVVERHFADWLNRDSEERLFVTEDQLQQRAQRLIEKTIRLGKGCLYCFSTEEPLQFFELKVLRNPSHVDTPPYRILYLSRNHARDA